MILLCACATQDVRRHLRDDHQIAVPEDTRFVGGAHNTTADTVQFFDEDNIPDTHRAFFDIARANIAVACGKNALERYCLYVCNTNNVVSDLQNAKCRVHISRLLYIVPMYHLNSAENVCFVY